VKNWCRIAVLLLVLVAGRTVTAGTLVQFQIFFGVSNYVDEVDVELYDQDKPITVNNFIKLVRSGAYNNGFFHRCIPGFVLQGGGFTADNPFSSSIIGPPYFGLGGVPNFGLISNEFKVGTFRSNTNGTIAMAKGASPDSASSQFFFNIANNAAILDNTNNAGGFTVFGHIVRGVDIVDQFNSLSPGNGIVNLVNNYGTNNPLTSAFTNLPNMFVGTNAPPYYGLAYFQVNLLELQIARNPTNSARSLTWTTVFNATNVLEFSTNLPPSSWQTLSTTNGNGLPKTVIDSSTNNTRRYYRVRVLF
jgi:cyclophilin family peptidyl-prolyl cis-trans isomerase